mmetsp:Transcript_130127/g.376467  ORF Transcript_130127/g.376467 Transcript_130127/m.376467 type:complete len:238 (-) Transcript_130127:41-754(-)
MLCSGGCCADGHDAEIQITQIKRDDDDSGEHGPQGGKDDQADGGALAIFTAGASRRFQEPKAFDVRLAFARGMTPGLGLDLSEGSIVRVNRLDPVGPVAKYNLTVRPEEQVRVGDFIMEANGARGDARAMVMAMLGGGEIALSFRRPLTFVLEGLAKKGRALGLDLSYHPKSTCLVIKQVLQDGAVLEWNRGPAEHAKMLVDDFILAVNGCSGNPQDMHLRLRSDEVLNLVISRPAP